MKGHSILEVMMTTIIFSLFMFGLIAILDVGLKSWNMVDMKNEVQQEAIISMSYIARDLRLTDRFTAQIGGDGEEYAVFETAMGSDGYFNYDEVAGDPEWQAHIIYYTYPRDPVDKLKALDKSLPANKKVTKKLVRKIISHSPNCIAERLLNFDTYFTEPKTGDPGEPRVLSDHIYSMSMEENDINLDTLDITITITKNILEDRLAYNKTFDDGLVTEKMVVRNTVLLKNTK